ncbi:MAG: PorT family protein [Bacteroidetes bacterium]|jgi:hypothetical protein|nr:PorT family protein [Bacteroidota bacterium]
MKRTGLIIFLLTCIICVSGQGSSAAGSKIHEKENSDSNSIVRVIAGKERVIVESDSSSVKIQAGNREIVITDNYENRFPKVEIDKRTREDNLCDDEEKDLKAEREWNRRRFKGHLAGIEAGFNNYLTDGYSVSLPDNINYMSLHTGKSLSFNLNFTQLSIGLARHIGFVTGLGVNWNNYVFEGNNNIVKGENGVIEMLNPDGVLKKSKLTTMYLQLPVLFELQIPTDHKRLNLSFGTIGAVKLHSHSKMVYDNDDKIKSDDDFSLNMLRLGATARLGYENFAIYGTYYMTPLFKTDKTPGGTNLFPYEIGLAFTID